MELKEVEGRMVEVGGELRNQVLKVAYERLAFIYRFCWLGLERN